MAEWQRLLRRVRDLVNPPRYPEYQEYRDDTDPSPSDVPPAAGGLDDDALKMRRVQMVAGLAIILSIGGGAWLYFFDRSSDPAIPDARLRGALASEMMKAGEGVTPPSGPQRDSLDDIKRWASDLERRMERGYDSSTPVVSPEPLRAGAPYYGEGFDMRQPLVLPEPALSYGDSGVGPPDGVALSAPAQASGPSVTPSRAAVPARPGLPALVPSPEPPIAAPDPATRPDSPLRPYQRRSLEPVSYEPRSVEPY